MEFKDIYQLKQIRWFSSFNDPLQFLPEERYDYDGNNNMTYQGVGPAGSPTSSANWHITKSTYDSFNRLTRVQTLLNQIWDNRTTLAW